MKIFIEPWPLVIWVRRDDDRLVETVRLDAAITSRIEYNATITDVLDRMTEPTDVVIESKFSRIDAKRFQRGIREAYDTIKERERIRSVEVVATTAANRAQYYPEEAPMPPIERLSLGVEDAVGPIV